MACVRYILSMYTEVADLNYIKAFSRMYKGSRSLRHSFGFFYQLHNGLKSFLKFWVWSSESGKDFTKVTMAKTELLHPKMRSRGT
jgi:hypothetical protein